MKKVTVDFKCCRENQRTCNTLVFMYLMASKLFYVLMDRGTFN